METEKSKNSEHGSDASSLTQVEFLRELSQIVNTEKLSELEVESEGVRVTLKAPEVLAAPPAVITPGVLTTSAAFAPAPPPAAPVGSTPKAPDESLLQESLLQIVSPMVGVFYRAPSPSDPNFIEIGDDIEIGQTVALVEAMKVFNEITAEVAGTIVEIKAQATELVETGQVLITIRP